MAKKKEKQPQDPIKTINAASSAIYFIGGLSLAIGLASVVFQVEFLQQLGVGGFSALLGVIYIALGYFVRSQRSLVALSIAFALYLLDTMGWIFLVVENGGRVAPAGIGIRIAITWLMWQGFGAIRTLDKTKNNRSEGTVAEENSATRE